MLVGLDRLYGGQLATARRRLRSARFALLTHAAAVDRRGRQTLTVLEELGANPQRIFTPEHGLEGVAQAEEAVGDTQPLVDGELSPKVISLYGKTRKSLTPLPEDLEGLELLVIDLVDVGSRYYTYVWTALLAARAAQAAGIHTLILDRPNPISGNPDLVEGTPQRPEYLSFVGLESIPTRHALTLGEIVAHFFERDGLPLGPDGALSVASPLGWERLRTAEAYNRPFVMPSPNMPTLETALVYPGACLVEGTNLSEGRGTTVPFQVVGAPFLDARALCQALLELGAPGAQIRPVSFRPSFEKHAGKVCQGVMVHVTDGRLFRPVTTYARLIALAKQQAPESFAFRTDVYEFESERPAFDLLTGSDQPRKALEAGAHPEELVELIAPVPADWREQVAAAETRMEKASA